MLMQVTRNLYVVTVWFTSHLDVRLHPGVEAGVHRSSTEKLLLKEIACNGFCFSKVAGWWNNLI